MKLLPLGALQGDYAHMREQGLTFEEYLAALPAERRGEVERVWQVVRENVPTGYREQIGAKFLTFMAGTEGFIALASQKNYISLYLTPLYIFPHLKQEFDAVADKKLKCGKGCISFRRADELPLEALARIIAGCPDAAGYQMQMQQMRRDRKGK